MVRGSILYHMKEPGVHTLGPNTRYALWVQGCPRRCPGCVAPEAQDMDAGTSIRTEALAWEIIVSGCTGITISGGEPFMQAIELANLLACVRRFRPDIDVIVYSGYTYEELQQRSDAAALLSMADVLIDGEYIAELDDGRGLRGSSNQRVIMLTDRYRDQLDLFVSTERVQETFKHTHEDHLVGLPVNTTTCQYN